VANKKRRFTAQAKTIQRDLRKVITEMGATSLKVSQDIFAGTARIPVVIRLNSNGYGKLTKPLSFISKRTSRRRTHKKMGQMSFNLKGEIF
jgi:hypothetical protein